MSVKASGHVWELELPHAEAWVLMALADHADHEGQRIYPGIGLIAWKTGYSERQVQRIINALVARGILVLEAPHASRYGTNVYSIDWEAGPQKPKYERRPPGRPSTPKPGDKMSLDKNKTGDILSGDKTDKTGDILSKRDDIAMSPKPSIKPSIKPSLESARKNEKTRASSIPEDFEVTAHLREWAYEHCPDLDLERETEKFIAYYEARGTSMKRWDAAWRNWMLKAVDYTAKENRNNGKHPKDEAAERFLQAGFALVRGGQTLNPGNDDRPRLRRPGT